MKADGGVRLCVDYKVGVKQRLIQGEILTISMHRATYRMNRLPFGIKTAPAEFNRIIDQILHEIRKTQSYFDDIVGHGDQ